MRGMIAHCPSDQAFDDPAGSFPSDCRDPAGSSSPGPRRDPAGSFAIPDSPLPHLPPLRLREHPAPILLRRLDVGLLEIPGEHRHRLFHLGPLFPLPHPLLERLPIGHELSVVPQDPPRSRPEPDLPLGDHFDQESSLVILDVMPAAEEDEVTDQVPPTPRVVFEMVSVDPAAPATTGHAASPPVPRRHRPSRHLAHGPMRTAHRHRSVLPFLLEPHRAITEEALDDRGLERRRAALRIHPGLPVLSHVDDHLVALRRLHLLRLATQPVRTEVGERLCRRKLRSRLPPHFIEGERDQLHLLAREIDEHAVGGLVQRRHEEPPAG
jgi:hypothetical protein